MKNQDEEEKSYKKDLSEFFLQMNSIHNNDEKLKKIEEFASRYAECKKYYSKFGLAPVVTQDGQIIVEYFEL
jgi:methionine aminopeptidase